MQEKQDYVANNQSNSYRLTDNQPKPGINLHHLFSELKAM